jgi:nucleotide-binding universal stress UspA family protein
MFTRILVPTDFSPASDNALRYARALAAKFGAALEVLHVLDNDFLRAVVTDPHDVEMGALKKVQSLLTAGERERGAMALVMRSDDPADEIVSYARSTPIDLIVMGTHGRHGVAHLLMGSVAEKIVRDAPCPVMTVRQSEAVQRAPAAGGASAAVGS